jgi:DNA-directed RNA polymerase specialized sigma24 family protein
VEDGFDPALTVQAAADGDHQAWDRLVDHYGESVWAVTRDFKLPKSDAAAASQATWLRLLEQIGRLDHPAHVGSWLAATARDECLRKRGD